MERKKNLVEYRNKSININKNNEYKEQEKKHKDYKINKAKNRKEKIHSEISKLININMESIENKLDYNNINCDGILNINTSRSVDKDNLQNYSGEKISIITYTNSNTQTIEKEDISNDDLIQKRNEEKINNYKISKYANTDNNKKHKKSPNIKKLTISEVIKNKNIIRRMETKTEKDTIINSSNFETINESFIKSDNNNSKEENENEIRLTEKKTEKKIRNIFLYDISFKSPKNRNNFNDYNKSKIYFKDNRKHLLSPNFSLFDSNSTSNTYEKSKKKFKFHQSIDEACKANIYLKYNKTELINFFSEINLPLIYADKFIENGFDDLDVILSLTRTGITISNQNLKDIGIMSAGQRARILIHLEEKAEVFPFYLEQSIIYSNNSCKDDYLSNDSLFKFLSCIGCEKYVNNFRRNGYYNSEILFSQMLTRESISEKMIKEDICIDSEYIVGKIIKSLNVASRNYIKKLRKNKNKNLIFDNKIYANSCELCLIS